ncbi:hypothetical protein B4U79_02742 [Dinothrombium tinctorium]|uniref:Group XV phospholipase A2-like protein n=1 Tax=Dinothrombium tinctorium TaxID=1965070 RepID=A0A443QK33_9ACAR|nr:hypothetical protein B4U79_02742 [Dinothrombium tinctorium]
MGSQLKYRVEFTSPTICRFVGNAFGEKTLWLNIINFLPLYKDCWLNFAKLNYNLETKRSSSIPGVSVRAPGFGSTQFIEYIAPFPQTMSLTSYYVNLVDHLSKSGYRREHNLRGAPYDFRKAPHEQQEFFNSLKKLVERTYKKNGNKPIIFIGHSMGGNFAYLFLRMQSLSWKKKYIRALMTIATPWGGNFKYMYDYLYDDDYPANIFPVVRLAERTWSSMAFLLPQPHIFHDSPLISTPSFNYTSETHKEFFDKINNKIAYQMYEDVKPILADLKHPEVDVYVIGGLGYKTLRGLIYEKDSFTSNKKIVYGNGDEFVNQESLKGCMHWKENKKFKFVFKTIREDHLSILKNNAALQLISSIINEIK